MSSIEVFYQVEGNKRIFSVKIDEKACVSEIGKIVRNEHNLSEDIHVFTEDNEKPLDPMLEVGQIEALDTIKVHINRCKQIKVNVSYLGTEVQNLFAPSTSIKSIHKWVTEAEFGMDSNDASEVFLQLKQSREKPSRKIHIGSLISPPLDQIFFDLVPSIRVQGMSSMPDESNLAPDERALKKDLESPEFRLGTIESRWQLIERTGTIVLISIKAKDGLNFDLRLDCGNYPNVAPTGTFWNRNTDNILEVDKWPQGDNGRVSDSIKPGNPLYLPCDRSAINSHPEWNDKYPDLFWNPKDGIVQYLEIVHDLLNCYDYKPPITIASQ